MRFVSSFPPPPDTVLDDLQDLTQDDVGPPPEFLVDEASVVEPPPGYLNLQQQEKHESSKLGQLHSRA